MPLNARRIIRATRVMREAAEILDQQATACFECETLDGHWPDSANEAKEFHDKCRELANSLRDLCKHDVALDAACDKPKGGA